MRSYPDELDSGRLLVIADFEDGRHMELFDLVNVSGKAKYALDRKGGKVETGRACLQFTAGSPSDTIVVNNSTATNWYLQRDWQPYDLLMMSIHSPRPDLALEITIAGGLPKDALAARTSIPLQRGWNVVRLDLAEIGERTPLDNVRELRLAVSGISSPANIRFDDILLVGNRKDLFGDSETRDAGLYVNRVGRRWRIGAGPPGADFELTFANGQIVEWYNMAADPYRLRNLLSGTTLGPSPVVTDPPGSQGEDSVGLGEKVVARSRILEMNAVRAVVSCEWRFVDSPGENGLDGRPFQRWTYTIYPTGQIYVTVHATARTATWEPAQLGLAVSLASRPGDGLQSFVSTPTLQSQRFESPAYATARTEEGDALLLYVVDSADRPMLIRKPEATERISFVASTHEARGEVQTWLCHLVLGSASTISSEEAATRAMDYVHPEAPKLEQGSFAGLDNARSGLTGYDMASGSYVITPEDGQVRFRIGGGPQPRFSPVFTIVNPNQLDAWVYVNHQILGLVVHDGQGNLVFQLPGTIREPTLVEVLFYDAATGAGS